jgi:tRNA-dihydrouridine synthase B
LEDVATDSIKMKYLIVFHMSLEKKFQYMLAPMEDYTDSCFRSICYGADLTFTEIVRMDALANNNASSLRRITLYDDTPTIIQFIGQKESSLRIFLSTFTPFKGFKGFNLNIGCPVPNFINQGLGCAMVKRTSKVKRMINIIKEAGYLASIKMRLGLNQQEKDKKVYLNLINEVEADFFVVHARHGNESYTTRSDWSVFTECLSTGKKIIANGDIRSKIDVEKLKKCDGVMIGKAALANPLLFAELKGIQTQPLERVMEEYLRLLEERKASKKYKKNVMDCIYRNVIPKEHR